MTPAIDIATVMRVLADPTRRAVFEQIAAAGELTVEIGRASCRERVFSSV